MKGLKNRLISGLLFLLSLALCFFSAQKFREQHKKETLFPSGGLASREMLSSYFPGLIDTPGDTEVYIYGGQKPGGNILILGGAHPNEPAGYLTAVILIENIHVSQGKIIVIPRANSSGFTHSEPQEGNLRGYSLETPGGKRFFRFGSRLTNPIHQWPDPTLYINPSGQRLSGQESRNINRCYPGKPKGHLTEKIAFAIMEIIKKEKIDLAIDLHEAAPEYPVVNAIVFHENSAELASYSLMELQQIGFEFQLELSPNNLRGLSHREWGDHAQVMAILLETANPSQGRLKGKSSLSLIIEGKDRNYSKAAKFGLLFVPFDSEGIPLKLRVARHLASIKILLSSFNELNPEKRIEVNHMPSSSQVKLKGIGQFLYPPYRK